MRVIGEQILYSRPVGFVREDSARETIMGAEKILESEISADLPFVWISDYSRMSGLTTPARKLFASEVARWPRLRGLIFFGLPPLLSTAVRLAVRLKLVSFPVHIVQSYYQAIEVATSILRSLPAGDQPAQCPPMILSDHRWKLELDDYSIRYEVIDGSILHSVQKGRVREEHLDPIFDLRDEVMRASGLKGKAFSILAGMDNMEKSSHAGRLGYIRRMVRWYHENPFDVEVFYGVNTMMRTVIKVSSTLTPFKVHVSKTFEEGLEYIAGLAASGREGTSDSGVFSVPERHLSKGVAQEKIDELLKVLGAISWDTHEALDLEMVDPADPLALVYEAVKLIKGEIDDLLIRQERDAAERRHLQERLAKSEKMEALGLLAGGVAHDLNNILSGIVSYPELLLMDPTLSHETRRAIETIKKSGEQAAAVVGDLMTISRSVAMKTEAVSLSAVVGEYLGSPDYLAVSSRHPDVIVSSRLEEGGAVLSGSPVHLRKVVANLVANAIESFGTKSDGGRVEVATSKRRVGEGWVDEPAGVPAGDYVVLTVTDNGPGIEEEYRERIFEPFFTKKIMGRSGTGLGLTVVWNTVHNHGGFIDLRSGEEGTSFWLFFPSTGELLRDKDDQVPLEELSGRGYRVLVVDDVAAQREIATALLVRLGYEVESVSSGEAAIEKVRSEDFDVLLLDMLMEPGLNGRETYEAILDYRPGQSVVIASGFSQDEEVRKVQDLGAAAFIAKPYSIEEVGVALRDALDRSGGEAE
jgi:signal transduction histidine kinase/ActR/RegA family two-component response regulator